MECVWKIHINQGSSLQLSFVDVDVQHTSSRECWGDHVEVNKSVTRGQFSFNHVRVEFIIIATYYLKYQDSGWTQQKLTFTRKVLL